MQRENCGLNWREGGLHFAMCFSAVLAIWWDRCRSWLRTDQLLETQQKLNAKAWAQRNTAWEANEQPGERIDRCREEAIAHALGPHPWCGQEEQGGSEHKAQGQVWRCRHLSGSHISGPEASPFAEPAAEIRKVSELQRKKKASPGSQEQEKGMNPQCYCL